MIGKLMLSAALAAATLAGPATAAPEAGPDGGRAESTYVATALARLQERVPAAVQVGPNTLTWRNGQASVTVPNVPGGVAPRAPTTSTSSRSSEARVRYGCHVHQYCFYSSPNFGGLRFTFANTVRKGRAGRLLNNEASSWINRATGCTVIAYNRRDLTGRVIWKVKPRVLRGGPPFNKFNKMSSWRCKG